MTRRVHSPEERSLRNFRIIFSAICAAAIVDSIYLANEYLSQNFNSCSLNDYFSCGTVAHSGYTSLFGIPFWVMGPAWFSLVLVVGLLLSKEILILLLTVGDLFTVYLWYLELGVIHAICPVCVSLYVFNYALTALIAIYLVRGS